MREAFHNAIYSENEHTRATISHLSHRDSRQLLAEPPFVNFLLARLAVVLLLGRVGVCCYICSFLVNSHRGAVERGRELVFEFWSSELEWLVSQTFVVSLISAFI